MINNIVVLRNFRNYFIELKNAGIANKFELVLLEKYLPFVSSENPFFKENDPIRDPINLLRLMNHLNDLLNSPGRGKIIELYCILFDK